MRYEHPRSAKLLKWFARKKKLGVPLSGTYFRAAGPRHTTAKDIVSGIGASKAGGRWNPIANSMKVVYLSDEPETALREANEHYRYYGLPLSDGLPKVVVAVQVDLERILDFTDRSFVKTIPEALDSILLEDWRAIMSRGAEATSQTLGWAVFAAGFQGMLVPSKAAPAGVNLLVFPDALGKKTKLVVLNRGVLDKLGRPS